MEKEDFVDWFNNTFLFNRDASSPTILFNNSATSARFVRIREVAVMLLENPNSPKLREQIALKFFITMRCALDYINYAKMILEEWKNVKLRKLAPKTE